jgi:2,3-bisphosphoglycerate-independent phosphoglycerate mutase
LRSRFAQANSTPTECAPPLEAALAGKRKKFPRLAAFAGMTIYDQTFGIPAAYLPQSLANNFGEWVSKHGKTQLRIAETEKYAHVTFFFNGGEESPYTGEERSLIQSPKDVPTYDHKPEMSAREMTNVVLDHIASDKFDAIILNYANADMVGHTGIIPAAVKAVETVDECLGKVADAVLAQGGGLLITADHGNCEQMQNPDGSPHTSHTTNLVPLIYVAPDASSIQLRDGGKLSDLAPTLLEMMRLPQPPEMTGCSLIV